MNKTEDNSERILVLTPSGNDAANALYVLHQAGLTGIICHNCPDLAWKSSEGAGAFLIAEEALTSDNVGCLIELLSRQPPWSDIPLLIITSANETEQAGQNLLNYFAPKGNVTLIERPLRVISLVSALQTALRARRRQYQVRQFLEEQQKTLARIQENEQRFRAVFNQQFQFMALLSRDGILLEINDLPLRTAGVAREQLIGKIFWETPFWAHLPEMKKAWPERLVQAATSDGPVLSVDTFQTVTGAVRIADAAVTAVKDVEGRVEFFIIQASDITERKRAENELKASEERLQRIFSSAAVGLALVDLNQRFLRVNPAYQAITGYSEEELLKLTVSDVSHLDDFPKNSELFRKLLDQKIPQFEIEKRYIRKTGEVIWVNAVVSLVRDADGNPLHFLGVIQDVTERKRLEQALRESEARFRFMAESMPQKINRTKPNGEVDYFNRRWMEYTGLSFEQIKDWGWTELLHPDDREENIRRWQHSVRTGEPFQIEHRFRRKDGIYRWHLTRSEPMRDAEGNIVMWIGSNTDIDDQKRAEEKLERTVAERTAKLQETISELEAFSYSVSHDLRAPLRAMQGYSQFLAEDYADKLDETGKDYINRIVKAAERLDRLVQDILTYSRVARRDFANRPIDLEKLIHDVIQGYPTLQPPKLKIQIQSPLLHVMGHEGSLTQCISNLLGNAVKFVPTDRQPEVTISTEAHGERVRINFKDNGIGIAPEHQGRIFNMFEQAHYSPNYEGTGIGLAIVRKAAERMGGHVGVESELGKGSTFWIDLPKA